MDRNGDGVIESDELGRGGGERGRRHGHGRRGD
jgi:hypothetical protein